MNKKSIGEIVNTLVATYKAGPIRNYCSLIPFESAYQYNKVLAESGWILDFHDDNSKEIDSDSLNKIVQSTIYLYEKSKNFYLSEGASEEALLCFPRDEIINHYFSNQTDDSLNHHLKAGVLACIAWLELTNFRTACGSLIGEYSDEYDEKDMENLIWAQSRLSVALSASDQAIRLFYQFKTKAAESLGEQVDRIKKQKSTAGQIRTQVLKAEAVKLYNSGQFKSYAEAGRNLLPLINEHAKKNGYAPLSTERGPKTISGWLGRAALEDELNYISGRQHR